MTPQEQAEESAKALEDAKAVDVKVYDVRGKSSLADFFWFSSSMAMIFASTT